MQLYYRYIFITMLLISACKKEADTPPYPLLASVTIVNAATDLGPVQADLFSGTTAFALLKDSVITYTSRHYTLPSGTHPFIVVPYRDTTRPLLDGACTFRPAGIYSLYIAGQAPAYDTLMTIDEHIPAYTDSVFAVRLVNLAAGIGSVNMSVASNMAGDDLAGITYKHISAFKQYPLHANPSSASVTFNVTDPVDKTILASFTLPAMDFSANPPPTIDAARFHTVTLVFTGTRTRGYKLFGVANY